jgi:REP element-mobilizing transposase RayT
MHQMITYRLADSLPLEVAQRLASELQEEEGESLYRKRIEAFLDAGHGACVLARPEIAQIVIDAWNHFDGVRYDLHAWVVMPNHVHVLIAMCQTSLSEVVHGWKSYTARKINAALGQAGKLWQEDYWDRYIRSAQHYLAAVEYILSNPGARASSPAWSLGTRASLPPGSRASSPASHEGTQMKKAAEDGRAPRG